MSEKLPAQHCSQKCGNDSRYHPVQTQYQQHPDTAEEIVETGKQLWGPVIAGKSDAEQQDQPSHLPYAPPCAYFFHTLTSPFAT